MSVRTDIRNVPGDKCPCQAAQEDIPRFTFLPTTLHNTKKVAFIKLTALKVRTSWMVPRTKPFLSSDSFVRVTYRLRAGVLGCHRTLSILGSVHSRKQRPKGHICSYSLDSAHGEPLGLDSSTSSGWSGYVSQPENTDNIHPQVLTIFE